MCRVVECVPVTAKAEHADRRIVLELTDNGRRLFHVSRVTLYINSARQSIRRIIAEYTPESVNTSLDITFEAIEGDYHTSAFDTPVASLIVDSRNNLLPKFRGYSLVDTRSQSNQ